MLKGVNPNGFYDFAEHQFPAVALGVSNGVAYVDPSIDEAIYGSDEFRMYAYKIKRCPRTRSHDWTECPYAHRGEKATRRDPRRFAYCAVACPAFRNGACSRGDACEFAHGVFEYWLHPARYRTRACNAGRTCTRKVCFFAHTPEQLRTAEAKHRCRFTYRPVRTRASDGGESAAWMPVKISRNDIDREEECMQEKVNGLLKSLSGLRINMDDNNDASELDLSHIDWISKLVD